MYNSAKKTPPLVSVKKLTVSFQRLESPFFAVTNASFEIRNGETLALVGESGSGKTLTALALLGLLPKAARQVQGEIYFKGKKVSGHKNLTFRQLRGKHISMIFQDAKASLNPTIPAGVQIADVIRTHQNVSRKLAKERSLKILFQTGLPQPEKIYHEYPHQLSGGMAQRVMIAMALSCQPQLIIADEPATALDITTQVQILELVAELQQKHQFALLLISHNIGLVATQADTVAVMFNGEIVEKKGTEALFSQPEHSYTKKLLESTITLPEYAWTTDAISTN